MLTIIHLLVYSIISNYLNLLKRGYYVEVERYDVCIIIYRNSWCDGIFPTNTDSIYTSTYYCPNIRCDACGRITWSAKRWFEFTHFYYACRSWRTIISRWSWWIGSAFWSWRGIYLFLANCSIYHWLFNRKSGTSVSILEINFN